MAEIDGIKHTTLKINGINMHIAEKGEGPVVLLLHGFPELWYSWRHQILALSDLGYRAVAPDMRGYGDTDAPTESTKYTVLHLVGDVVALIDALGADQLYVVGHDWGVYVARHLCLFRPDGVRAFVNLGGPMRPRNRDELPPVEVYRAAFGDDVHICRFQAQGEMEAEIEQNGVEKLLLKLFAHRKPTFWQLPRGEWFKDLPPRPTWISEQEFAYYVDNFKQKGITGGLNYYRAFNLSWELTAPWLGARVQVPTKLIVGDLDLAYGMPAMQDFINGDEAERDEMLKEVVVLEGVGHFLQQEKPEEVSNHIHGFFKKFRMRGSL